MKFDDGSTFPRFHAEANPVVRMRIFDNARTIFMEETWKEKEKKISGKNGKKRMKNKKKKKRMKKKSPQNVISNKARVRVRYQSRRQTEFTTHTNRAEPVCLHVVFILSSCFWFSTYTDILYTITICFCLACIVSRLYFWSACFPTRTAGCENGSISEKQRKNIEWLYIMLIERLCKRITI